jgi:tetratricopeptide (TPR) repeat protein
MAMNLLKRDFSIREPLLVSILVLITIVFSALTHSYSQAYDRRRTALGTEWFERGNQELQNGHPSAAVEDFRTALLYDPQNWDYSVHLADALTQAHHTEQALNYYLVLWQRHPSNGPVNLQLARLSAQKGDAAGAERYFNGAIFGDWPGDATNSRRIASLELINFYLERGDFRHAESQLMILADNLPEDPQMHTRVGDLYSRVGDDPRALNQYRQAVALDPKFLPAIQGAGEATFRTGDYHAAQTYFDRLLRLDDSNTQAKKQLAVIHSLLLLSPYELGLSGSEKTKRILRIFDVAGERLSSCSSSLGSSSPSAIGPLYERWKQLKAIGNVRFLSQHPEEADTLLDFATSAEKQAQSGCSEPNPDDSALLAIARLREMERR